VIERVSVGLLGDLDPCGAVDAVSAWNGRVWLAESAHGADAFVTAAALAAARPGRPIGFAVLVTGIRHSWTIVSGCRGLVACGSAVALGLGTGEPRWKRQLGLEGTRSVSALREEILRVREQLAAPAPAWQTKSGGSIQPVSVLVGAEGPRMLEMAAEVADGVILPFLRTDDYLRQRAVTLKTRAPLARVVCEVIAGVGDTAEAGADRLHRWLRYITRGPIYPDILMQAGLAADQVARYLDTEEATLPLSVVQSLAVLGPPGDCAEAIARRLLPWSDEVMVIAPGRHLGGAVAVANELTSLLNHHDP